MDLSDGTGVGEKERGDQMNNTEIGKRAACYTMGMGLAHSREKRFFCDWFESWDWGPGVAYYGLGKWYQKTGDPDVLESLKEYVDANRGRELVPCVNSTIPVLTALQVYEETGEEAYLKMVQKHADYMTKEAPRTEEGAVVHTGVDIQFPEEIWADTVFMAGVFLVKAGIVLKREEMVRDGVRQVLLHLKYLEDPEDHLLYHAYHCKNRNHLSAAKWARGNCWITVAIAEIYPLLDEKKFEQQKRTMAAFVQNQVRTLMKYQKDDGMWPTVLDREMKSEVSAAAGFAYGIQKGIEEEYLPPSCGNMVQRAADGVIRNISEDGRVTHVSAGTGVQKTVEDYEKIPDVYAMPWGQGLALMMLSLG